MLLEVGSRAPRQLVAVEEVLAGPGTAVIVAREEITVAGRVTEVRRILRYRVVGEQFTECWLYQEDQALIDLAWSKPS